MRVYPPIMCWEAEGDYLQHRLLPNISRYLGVGTELSMVALKNQVRHVEWYGGDSFPVEDIHWIARQYYYDLLKYAGLFANQQFLNEVFSVSPNMWCAAKRKHHFMTVEDEAFNMFEVRRVFSTRAMSQGFVNVISPNYLLRDYMAENEGLFNADPKAIPYFVADYAHTRRNVALRLSLRLCSGKVREDEMRRELMLIDADTDDIRKSFWHEICRCYSFGNKEPELDSKGNELLRCRVNGMDTVIGIEAIAMKRMFSEGTMRMENLYFICDETFKNLLLNDLRSAEYIAEDENGEKQFLGTELQGHVFQKYLPGQFLTFNGKHYEMLKVTSEGQIMVRRAADHIAGRPSYRQQRKYIIAATINSDIMGDSMDIGGIRITKQYADIRVETSGYWQMPKYNDFENGSQVKVNGIPERSYCGKQMLKIELTHGGNKISSEACRTIALLMNEVFRTLFAENQDFIVALCAGENDAPFTCNIASGDGFEASDSCIYIIEDSQLDIGLLEAVRRNFKRIMAIVCDYIDWHEAALEASVNPPAEPAPTSPDPISHDPETQDLPDEKPKKGLFKIIGDFFKKLFGKKKNEGDESQNESVLQDEDPEPVIEYEPEKPISPEKVTTAERRPYKERYYLLYGGTEVPESLDICGTKEFLVATGFGNSELKQARDGKSIADMLEKNFVPNKRGSNYCDFCGTELIGTEYEVLSDGRERCMICGRTSVKSEAEFIAMYNDVLRNMRSFFGIKITAPITVQMVNSKKLHRKLKKSFVPTGKQDPRTLGVAIKNSEGYFILVENGAPRLRSIMTMVHELTHIWQFLNWDMKAISKKYGEELELAVYEGMAKWAEIQYAYLINETEAAKREEIITRMRDDEYGQGFVKYADKYPLSIGTHLRGNTPFEDKESPL